eukprot:847218-Prymnesium_polylepis.1
MAAAASTSVCRLAHSPTRALASSFLRCRRAASASVGRSFLARPPRPSRPPPPSHRRPHGSQPAVARACAAA